MTIKEKILTFEEWKKEPNRKYITGFTLQYDTVLIYREKKIKWHLIIKDMPWYFCITRLAYQQNRKLFQQLALEDKIQKITCNKDSEYIKIYCRNFNQRNVLDDKTVILRECQLNQIQTYEADIQSHIRLLIDRKLQIATEYQVLYIDIETDDRGNGIQVGRDRILSIAAMNSSGKVYYYTGDEKDILRRFTKRISLYDIIIGWNCLPTDSKILTADGYKQLGTLKKGDMILGYRHKKIVKTKILQYQSFRSARLLQIKTHTGEIVCTENHRIFVWRQKGKCNARFKYQKQIAFKHTQELQASRIQLGDYLLTPQKADFLSEEITNLKRGDCYLAGFSITDGTIPAKGKHIIFYNSRDDILNWISKYLKRPISKRPTKRRVKTLANAPVNSIIRDTLKLPASPHTTCEWDFSEVRKLSKPLLISFLAGIIDADGGVGKSSVNICQKNNALLYELQPILLALGIKTTLSNNLRLTVEAELAQQIVAKICKEMKHTDKKRKIKSLLQRYRKRKPNVKHAHTCECFFLTRVMKITKLKKKQTVIDIETSTNNFIAENHLIHNSEKFDLPYLQDRCRIHRVYFNWKQVIHIDMMQKMMEINRKNYALIKKVRSFALDAVSKEFLGIGKLKRVSTWEMFINDPDRLKKYNIRDVELLRQLDEKLKIIRQKIIEHSITGCFLTEYAISRILDIYILRNAKQGTRFKTKPPWQKSLYENREARYKGGLVFEPVRGIHQQVYHLDFSSMYPSIIRTFNISPETWKAIEQPEYLKSPNNQFYSNKEGIIPSIIGKLLTARNEIRYEKMKGMEKEDPKYTELYFKQYAFKTMANSFYGILGAPFTRYFKTENAEAITLAGQYLMELVKQYFESMKAMVIYGDSDSVFVISNQKLELEAIHSKINFFIAYHLSKHFNITNNYIDLKIEAIYKRVLLVNKKRYVKVENNELVIVGLEAKRRESIALAASMQVELLEMLLLQQVEETEIKAWLVMFKRRILSKKLTKEEVLIQIKLSKDVDKYDKMILDDFGEVKEIKESKLPHIKVAKWLKAHNIKEDERNSWEKGSYVRYIITGKERGKGLTAESIHNYQAGSYDPTYYWNRKFYPMLQRILEVVYPETMWSAYLIDTRIRK